MGKDQVVTLDFVLVVIGTVLPIPLFRPLDRELVFALKSLLVSLLAGNDVEVIACFRLFFGLLDLDVVDERVVSIRVGVRIRLSVLQVGKQDPLVVIGDQAALLDFKRVHL